MLVTALASALGTAVMVGPSADAAKPAPPPATARLAILEVLDDAMSLPDAAPAGDSVGLIRPGEPFSVTVQSRTLSGDPLVVGRDTDVALSGGGVSAVVTIPKDGHTGTVSGVIRSGSSNFVLTASGPKNAGYESDTIPVTVALESFHQQGLGANQVVTVQDDAGEDCVLSSANPTCVSLSVDGVVSSAVVLTTSECAGFLGGTATGLSCEAKKGITPLVAQTFVDLAEGQVATAILYCDKSRCGQGGVSSYIPLVDKGNTGTFVEAPECPAKGELGTLHMCVDLRQSTRLNAGDLATYILFDHDARSLH